MIGGDEGYRFAHACVAAFRSETGRSGSYRLLRIARANALPELRQVFRLRLGGEDLALKIDLKSPLSDQLARDHRLAGHLFAHFGGTPDCGVPRPVHLGANGRFRVAEFLPHPTVQAMAAEAAEAGAVHDLARRGGRWLAHLHRIEPARSEGFWPRWMLRRLDAAAAATGRDAPQAGREQLLALRAALRERAMARRGAPARQVFSHGDAHPDNFIAAPDRLYGLDFTEARFKLAVYDAVDFVAGLDLRAAPEPAALAPCGVSAPLLEAFLEGYGEGLDRPLLELCLTAKLAMDLGNITVARHARSAYQRRKFAGLMRRLSVALPGAA